MHTLRRRTLVMVAAASVTLAGVVGAVSASAASHSDPGGNNGTIKIDAIVFDSHPNNQPHVGCTFQVDFYGYDKGVGDATVTFTAKAPTLPASGSRTLLTDRVPIGEDSHAGGGSTAGLDASRTYTLDVSGISPQPHQGVHMEVTVNAPGSRGADVKHKVFWVKGCAGTPSPSVSPTPSVSVTPSPSVSVSPTPSPSMSGYPSPTVSSSESSSPSPSGSISGANHPGPHGCADATATSDECTTVGGSPHLAG